jgi:hypothetical protein
MTFDDVMDSKCTQSNPQNPNYVGPWDGGTSYGQCDKYECPLETCYYLSPDPAFPIVNGKTWVSKSIPQQFNIDSKECITNHGTNPDDDSIDSIKYYCDASNPNQYKNNENHLEKKTCYEYDEDYQRFVGTTYYNVLDRTDSDGSNIYLWKSESGTSPDQTEISNCMETKLDCSACNYYCCEYDPLRRCDGTPRTLTSNDINRIVIYKYHQEGNKCIKDDNSANCFGDSSCENSTFSKDCWQFDTYNLVWKNEKFIKQKQRDGTCLYVNTKGDIWDESLYTLPPSGDPFCLSNLEGKKTNEECNRENNLNCDYLDINEQHQSVTYEPTLNYAGTECVWKTLDKRHFIQPNSLERTQESSSSSHDQTPETLMTPVCPSLSPKSCKDSNNDYLRQYNDETAPECVPCPIDMFRNSNMNIDEAPSFQNDSLYCTPKVSCDENSFTSTQCMVEISPNIFRNTPIRFKRNDKFKPTHPDYGKGDKCVFDAEWAEAHCERVVNDD